MVIDSNSTRRSKDGRGGNDTRKNPAMPKGKPTIVSAPSSLRRSTRGMNSREQIKSTSLATETVPDKESIHFGTRKSERIEKNCKTPPVKRKSEILESDMSSSPLRRSDRGKKLKSLASLDSNNNGKVNDSPNVKKKILRSEKSVKELTVEAMETHKEAKQVKGSNGRIKKTMNGHAYKDLFLQRRRKQNLPALAEDLETPEKPFQGDETSLVDNVSNHVEDEADGAEECPQKTEEEGVERDCGGKEQSVFKENNDNTLANHGELESSCLNLYSSREALGEPSQENGVNAFSENMIIEKSIDALVEDEANGAEDCPQKTEEERVERDCEGKEQSVFKENNDNTLANHGELESSYLNLYSSREALGEPSQENGVNAFSENMVIEKSIDALVEDEANGAEECPQKTEEEGVERDCGGKEQSVFKENNDNTLANHGESQENGVNAFSENMITEKSIDTLVVELQIPEEERLPHSNVVEAPGLVSFPSSECEEDKSVGACASCYKRERLNDNSPMQKLCSCSLAATNDVLKTSPTEDRVELAQCDDALSDALNDGNLSTCAICKLDKNLRCCDGKGCRQAYHLSCLDIPLDDGLPGVWHCFSCVKKKIEFGVQSVSSGIDAIWDAREVKVQDDKGLQMERQFLVKYKGLSHIHNQWIPETQLLLEASMLVSEFDKQKQDSKWRQEWIVPHRLLKKRLLWSSEHPDNSNRETSNCQYEWLVKWCGLDYEHATWELENGSIFQSPQFQSLLRESENRHHRAKEAVLSSSPDKSKKHSLVKLPKLPNGCSFGDDHNQETSVDKLFEFWSKRQNAIVFDDQKRFAKLVLFIVSLASDVTQPFLIISSPSTLSVWEAEFSRLAPFINVVVYTGNQDNRKIIRSCEFYANRDRIMLQVLLSSAEAVVEDLGVILPRWEAIIVDECHDTGIYKHFEQIKMLTAAVKILLFNGQLEEITAEHLKLLPLLDSPKTWSSISGLKCCELRERLSPFIAYDCMPGSSRFLEYWVPVSASNVQLEQYCATLLSHSTTLRSSSLKNIAEAFHDILISTKKCCDHPYLVDSGLQWFLNKDLSPLDYLDMGIKASGKLQLLDTILSEMKSRGKRVLVLYQSVPLADILDDFLRQRFGVDSYERVEGGTLLSKKQAAKIFNDKCCGRFVLLLEKRACSSAIKLTSIDVVVIFDSDWNILNDSRALHKLSIDSYPEPIKVFRLFTSGTLEEKVLDHATNNAPLDSNLHKLSRTTSHMLLMWGASHLFNKLDEFHGSNALNSGASLCSDISMLKNVAGELLDILTQKAENPCKDSLITKVRQTGVTYTKNVPLFGQLKGLPTDGKEPCLFWKELLESKNPRWRLLPVPSQRNRKRVHYFSEPDDVTKKQKKTVNSSADAVSPKTRQGEGEPGVIFPKSTDSIPFSSNNVSPASEVPMADSVEGKNLGVLQKNLHGLLMPTISELSEVLQISEDMKTMGEIFLEYIVNNHQINSESESILQALQISLIWIAASLLKHKLDKKQTLDVAKRQLGFGCTEKEVNDVYLRLRRPKKKFKKTSKKCKELLSKKDVSEDQLKNIQNKCEKLKTKLQQEHEEEIQEFYRTWEGKRAQIDKDHRAKSAVIRKVYFSASAVKLDKLKEVDDELAKKLDEHKREKDLRFQELKGKHLDERTKKYQKADSGLKSVQENVVSVSGEKMCLNRIETTEAARSTITLEIPTIPLHSLSETGKIEKQLGKLCCSNDAFGNSTVGDNHPCIAEQIPDSATSGVKKTDENDINRVSGGVESSDIYKPSGESKEDNNQRKEINIVDSELMKNCRDAAGGSNHYGIFTEPPLVTSYSVQILEAPAQDVASPPNLAYQGESSKASTSAEILVGDSPGCENSNPLEQTDVEQPTSTEFIAHNNDAQVCENSHILEQALVHPLHPTSVDVSILGSCTAPSILHHGDSGANENHDVINVINTELTGPLPNVEQPPSQNGERHNAQNDEVLNYDDTQLGTTPSADAPVVGLVTHHPSRRAQHMDVSAQLQHFQSDPLQIEMERLHKETEEASKLHEDAKLQVKSEYEKEQAELRRKYETKLEGVEAVYLMKMKERDANHKRVFMNRLLAETFQTNCLRPSESSGMYQVAATNYQQQLRVLLSQSRRTSAVSCFPNIVPPASNQQNILPPVPAPPCSYQNMQMRQPCTRFIGNVPAPPPGYQQNAVPSVPAPPPFSPTIGSLEMRQNRTPPNIRPIGNFPISGEIRAPAPHLRPLSTSAPSIPPASLGLPHHQPIQVDRVRHLENMGFQNPFLLTRAPTSGSSQCGNKVGGEVNLAPSSVSSDVVCLSDDE